MTAALAYDEMVSGKKSIRPHWREVMSLVWGMPPELIQEKQARAVSHLSAADQFLGEGRDAQPIWSMDLLPLILPEAEWKVVAHGLSQRARLLNLILADIYGPQTLIREKLLPPYLVFNNPGFLRPLRFVASASGAAPLHFYAADLVRLPDGNWRVFADRTQAPAGLGYALRHRSVAARSFPEAFRNTALQRLQPTIDRWQTSLQAIGATFDENPSIVLLTPGPHNPSYSEHVLLAHELGATLAQGSDLTVREGMVYLKTLSGLERVHVVYRRVDGDYCDPLELRPDSALGVAGLIAAARAGNVAILNLPGSAVVETPAFAPFLPAIARKLLGEELALPAVTTWWCGQGVALAEALAAPDNFVFQPAFNPDPVPIDPARLSADARADFLAKLTAMPESYVAVERVHHSRVPVFGSAGLEPRPVVLRASAMACGDEWLPMPGGVARIAEGDGQRQALRFGGIVKDVWVLKEETTAETGAAEGLIEIRKLHRAPDAVSSRTADDLFWLGRYMERLDSGLRQFRAVVARLAQGSPDPRDIAELGLLTRLMQQAGWIGETTARARVDTATFANGVATALSSDGDLADYQAKIRELAIALRDRLSQDTWRIINNLAKPLQPEKTASADLDSLLGDLDAAVLSVATFSGLVADNMTRGMGWRFLEIGRRIERGMFVCNAVEALFGDRPERVELSVRLILELCDSMITHRKRFPMDPYTLAGLDVVLSDNLNPRSLFYQLEALREDLDSLIGHDPLAAEKQLVAHLREELQAAVPFADRGDGDRLTAITAGVTACEADLCELSSMITRSFFSHMRGAPTVVVGLNTPRARVAS